MICGFACNSSAPSTAFIGASMSLIAAGGPTEPAIITNAPFFPDIAVESFRDATRVDGTVTNERCQHALEAAISDANDQLSNWVQEQVASGVTDITGMPIQPWQRAGYHQQLYLRAVYSLAKADLIERYRDYDTTGKGHQKADALAPADDDYRRNAAWALSDVRGDRRTTVELI
jgi:hypothetical protein